MRREHRELRVNRLIKFGTFAGDTLVASRSQLNFNPLAISTNLPVEFETVDPRVVSLFISVISLGLKANFEFRSLSAEYKCLVLV